MIFLFQQFIPRRKLLLIASEGLLLTLVVLLGTSLPGLATHSVFAASSADLARGALSAFLIAVLVQINLSYNELYDWRVSRNRADLPNRLLRAAGFSFITLAVLVAFKPSLFFFPGLPILATQTWKLVVILGVAFAALFYWRIGFHWFFFKWGRGEKILILGNGPQAQSLCRELDDRGETGFEIVALVGGNKDEGERPEGLPPHYPETEGLAKFAHKERVSRVIVALEDRRGTLPVQELLACKLAGIRIEERELLYEKVHGKISLDSLRPSYLIFSSGFKKTRIVLSLKRLMDIAFAIIGLTLSMPVTIVTAIAIKLDSRGPVLLRQRRMGLDGHEFTCLKFRSMRVDAEKHSGPVWAMKSDDRITKVGRFIRQTRIDEIPQMWNVLVGDMSFVGPRPERRFFVEQLTKEIPYYTERMTVRPGLTGWAQTKYPYGASIEDARQKLMYDLYYIKYMSLLFDLSILVRTIKVIVLKQGSR
ncbi:MAG: capsular biosynthesis protein CpsE [Planctomycetota bacterium]|nr:MAG: capsular biosynthesis protein CpsE [Planctomycetota bacterium]